MNADSKYPNRRAYVVKVRSDATRGALRGRLENLITCDQRDFESAQELLDLIERDLDKPAPRHRSPTDR
ncbi:MAG: hypothetical protein K0M64_06875 [Rhizobium sp.]|nr:hypothetical protein [Rhizobium sp.]